MEKQNNGKLIVKYSKNATPISVIVDNHTEILYQGDGEWKKIAPTIFPALGITKTFKHNGQEYPMSKHGFWNDIHFDYFYENNSLNFVGTLFKSDKYPFSWDIEKNPQ